MPTEDGREKVRLAVRNYFAKCDQFKSDFSNWGKVTLGKEKQLI
jgi:hypothetical protein